MIYFLSKVNGRASLSEKAPNPIWKSVVKFFSVPTVIATIVTVIDMVYLLISVESPWIVSKSLSMEQEKSIK